MWKYKVAENGTIQVKYLKIIASYIQFWHKEFSLLF